MRKQRKGKLNTRLSIVVSALIPALVFAVDASELDKSIEFNIPAQPLNAALLAFSKQSGVQLAVQTNIIEGVNISGIVGQKVTSDALSTLLDNTGLTYTIIGDDTVAISELDGSQSLGKSLLTSAKKARTSVATSSNESAKDTLINRNEQQLETISVVGSKIGNLRTEAALPVAVFDQDAIDAIGASDGNELIRSMPQMGDMTWNESWIPGSSNAARGDMGSLNLKNLGASNTLLLVNGRRSVIHPTTSTVDNSMSTTTFNTNAIPMYGLDRVEVLLDGAAAIYGSDAIAGVVNIVTNKEINGAGVKLKYGAAPGTERSDTELTGYWGSDFDSGRGNVSVMYNLSHREPQYTSDQWYTATSDHRDFLNGTDLQGSAALDRRSTYTPWGNYIAPGQIFQNGNALTSSAGYFHTETGDSQNCITQSSQGTCFVSGSATGDYKYDASKENTYLTPKVDRFNVFTNFTYQLMADLELFGELSLYKAKTEYVTGAGLFSVNQPVYVPADAYYNPLGAMYLADGSLNSNRIANLDNVSEEGSVVQLRNYRFADAGVREVDVDNMQTRFLVGLKGWTINDFEWESAMLYSQGKSVDKSEGYSVSKIVDALSGTTADAYNPFAGGSLTHPSYGDDTANSQAVIDSFTVWTKRESTSELASWDFKVNKSDLLNLPAGELGFAAGIEVRYESLKDDRDPLLDGTAPYTDWYTGTVYDSDLAGSSPTPDSYGSRNVKTAYLEFAVPLIAEDFNIPLMQSLDMQLAARYESYSDVGDISTPKVALAWAVSDDLMFRGSWSEGFKAPNLEVLNAGEMARYLTFPDYIYCEAAVRAEQISGYSQCTKSYDVTWHMKGNDDLEPETSENVSVGGVFTPQFLPDNWGNMKFTLDAWRIQIDDQIGVTPTLDVIIHDLYLRTQQGTTDPRVFRADPSSDDIALFSGTGLDAVGEIQYVQTDYANLNSLEARGVDFSFDWSSAKTEYGSFSFNFAVSKLLNFKQALTQEMQDAKAAQDAGLLDAYIVIGTADEVGRSGKKPEWKGSSRFIWHYEDFIYRLSAQYTGSVLDGKYASGLDFEVPSIVTWNTSAQYQLDESILDGVIAEIGVRNIFDKEPPLNASGNYLANLYLPFSRYVYASLEKKF
ncbi:TonB-dependent receptor [Paraglaciecola sp. 20A4]|uniref:TonB-dependent receptor n=1 Tax=Paraglaciecola sp. 20A4 TaxID=2687288 RepID=UPI00140CCCF6|nr:TonB-dependent receptor [Paraglaciecola sp. 20A4]